MERLSSSVIEFIKSTNKSYSEILRELNQRFGIKTCKSVVSYYKRNKSRITSIDISLISEWELEWLFGLYFADGSKFKGRRYDYTLKFCLDRNRDQDIAKRVIRLLRRTGVSPTVSFDKNVLVIRVFSKNLYGIFPNKSENYRPINIFAFIAGLIDGDGWSNGSSALIVQRYFEDLMFYLSENLGLSKYEQTGPNAGWKGIKITYYVSKRICKILRDKNYCIKILRKTNNLITN